MYDKITLCGSTRFIDIFNYLNAELTLEGHLVYSVAVDGKTRDLSDEQKAILDAVHLNKINEADYIVVIDMNKYIGESTRKEIAYAKITGKNVFYLSVHYKGVYELFEEQYKKGLKHRQKSDLTPFEQLCQKAGIQKKDI